MVSINILNIYKLKEKFTLLIPDKCFKMLIIITKIYSRAFGFANLE